MSHSEMAKDSTGVGDEDSFAGRPTWAEIDLDALAANLHTVRRQVGPGVKVAAVVKANAYGHGAVRCAERLAAEGIDWFSVALPEEGIALRRAGITEPILCLGGFWEGQAAACLQYNLVPVIYRIDMAEAYNLAAQAAGVIADFHIKIDTGMGRLGVRSDAVGEFAHRLRSFKNIRVDGVMTHFAAADAPDQDCFTNDQVTRFQEALNQIRERGHTPTYEDMANSPAIYAHPKARANLVRPGGVLYGLWRDVLQPQYDRPEIRPVMRLRSRVTLLKWVHRGETIGYGCTFEAARETLVATLPIGYHDGYMRALSNRGRAIVRGRYAPVVGRVSMDLTLVDVTDVPDVSLGDTVTLMGTDGELSIPVEDVAKTAGTLSYEITCGISERVPRRYLPEARKGEGG